jgi:hypothetical protein
VTRCAHFPSSQFAFLPLGIPRDLHRVIHRWSGAEHDNNNVDRSIKTPFMIMTTQPSWLLICHNPNPPVSRLRYKACTGLPSKHFPRQKRLIALNVFGLEATRSIVLFVSCLIMPRLAFAHVFLRLHVISSQSCLCSCIHSWVSRPYDFAPFGN